MLRSTVILLVFFSSLAQAQVVTDSLLIEGHYRTFHYKNPGNEGRTNLMFVMHGSGGDGISMMHSTQKLEDQSKAENLLLVYPDGYKRYWNECRKAATS